MIKETKKILHDDSIQVAATCVRLPFVSSHAESGYVELGKDGLSVADVQNVLKDADGVILEDDPTTQTYPTPLSAMDKDEEFVGPVRKDLDEEKGYQLGIVSFYLINGE